MLSTFSRDILKFSTEAKIVTEHGIYSVVFCYFETEAYVIDE